MEITKESIDRRLEALKKDLQVLYSRINAVEGAILDCEYWQKVLSEPSADTSATLTGD